MKKTTIVLFLSLIISSSFLQASDMEFMRNMVHSNPVPNYVSDIKMNADKLGLNEDQKAKVMAWNKKNGPAMAAMVKSVIDGEKEIKMASMEGASQAEISAMSNKLMDTRKKIIAGKTTCRDYVMKILSDAQWQQLTDIIKAG